MNNNDERDFAEESYNAAEYRREYEAELLDEKAQTRTVVHLSDTSHPFTSYEHNPRILHFSDEERKALESLEGEKADDGIRILSTREHEAIRTFASKWGFSHNERITDDLVGMLEDTTSVQEMLINHFMHDWDLNGASYDGVELDLIELFELFDLRETDKVDEGMQNARKDLFREESDKRVIRYFIGQSGWVWVVHFIVDMPEQYDASRPMAALYRAMDGMTTLHMTNLYMSEEKAWESINSDIRLNTLIDDDVLTHVVELDKM